MKLLTLDRVGLWIVLACAFSLSLGGCDESATQPSGNRAAGESVEELNENVEVEVVSIASFTGEKVRLILKVTNVSTRNIVRAKALVTVLDEDGNSLGAKSTYLVHGNKGGLAAGGSLEEDAIIEVSDKTKAASMSFEMEKIRFER